MTPSFSARLSALDSLLLRAGGHMMSRGGRHASLLVLIFHRVLPKPDPLLPDEPDATSFAAQMDLLAALFNVLPLREAVARLHSASLPPRSVCITFDDGYANNCEVALPILAARKLPATVFVAPGYLNGGRMFNDTVIEALRGAPAELDLTAQGLGRFELPTPDARRRAFGEIVMKLKYRPPAERVRGAEEIAAQAGVNAPTHLMMTDAQVRRLATSGIEIGAHTMTHPILARIDADTARAEIAGSKHCLEELTGQPVLSFAYPNGRPVQDYDRTHVTLARETGFELAVSTAWGAATAAADAFQIPRVSPWDTSARRYAVRLVRAYAQRRFQTA